MMPWKRMNEFVSKAQLCNRSSRAACMSFISVGVTLRRLLQVPLKLTKRNIVVKRNDAIA